MSYVAISHVAMSHVAMSNVDISHVAISRVNMYQVLCSTLFVNRQMAMDPKKGPYLLHTCGNKGIPTAPRSKTTNSERYQRNVPCDKSVSPDVAISQSYLGNYWDCHRLPPSHRLACSGPDKEADLHCYI